MNKNFKILSLDGGGVRGYLTILILEKLEKALQRDFNDKKTIGERFDLIVGTSTGGIIAAGLSIGKSAEEIRKLYENLLYKIFKKVYKGIHKPKYNQNILKNELQKILENKTFHNVKTHLCLVSVDISTSKPRLFKSVYEDIYVQRADERLVDAVLATSAAPSFFAVVDTKHSSYLADGGLVANNPAMIGFTEGFRKVQDIEKLRILSVGTGEMAQMPYDIDKIKRYGGMLSWAFNAKNITDISAFTKTAIPIIEVLLNTQSNLINSHLSFILQNKFFRINPILSTPVKLDEINKIKVLKNFAIVADSKATIRKVKNLLI